MVIGTSKVTQRATLRNDKRMKEAQLRVAPPRAPPRTRRSVVPAGPVTEEVLVATANDDPARTDVLVAIAAHLPPTTVPHVLPTVPTIVTERPEVPRAQSDAADLIASGEQR